MVTLSNRILLGLALVLAPRPGLAFFYRSRESTVAAADSILVTPETITNVVYTNEKEQQQHRDLQTLGNASFVPLSCNSPMQSPCDSFSSVGASYTTSGLLTIPCGKCVTMDITDNRTLTFTGGMRIIGKLDFPNSAVVMIKTPSVIIEGELSIISTDVVTGTPKIKFILTGSSPVTFTPSSPNSLLCGSSGCNVGPKAIVVAGGKLDVKGIADDCPTVAYMMDMGLSKDIPIPTNFTVSPITAECPEVIINQTFDAPDLLVRETGFFGGMGASAKIMNGSYDKSNLLFIGHRYAGWQGATYEATQIQPCLSSDVAILFTAMVKLLPNGTSPDTVLTRCKSACCNFGTGNGCPSLKVTWMAQDARIYRQVLVTTSAKDIVSDGLWFPLTGQFQLNKFMTDPSNIYISFSISGVESKMDLYIDDIVMKYPPPELFPPASQVCSDLAFGGRAELLKVFPYPMYSFMNGPVGGLLRTVPDPTATTVGNNVFKIVSRSEVFHGLAFEVNPSCVPADSVYYFSARVFLNNTNPDPSSKNPDTPIIMLKKKANNQTTFASIATCPLANYTIGWVKCQGFYKFKAGDSAAESLQISFMMMTDKKSDMLYDDISFTYASGGVSSPIFNNSVGACWGPGANVYLASQGINVTASSLLKIVNKTTSVDNTTLRFNSYVDAVPLSKSIDFATEFALTSRNIHFESEDLLNPANGATLTVLSTPSVPQLLQGVALNGFGQQGLAFRFPVLFKSCGDSSGSVVSKNAITNSNQRCIVLQATNGVTVKGNVAYNTAGHCYALEDGSEVNNSFEGNFGARTTAAKVIINGETDNNPATFFITNPNNYYNGNIAAGSVDTGFFFSLQTTVLGGSASSFPNLNPSVQPLGSFTDNVAHSNALTGIKTWPSGYSPPTMASFVNSKVFRNRGTGIYLQGGQRIAVQGGVLADNRIAIAINFNDDVLINGTKIIGYSDDYEAAVILNKALNPPCPPTTALSLYGILLNANAKNVSLPGTTVSNVMFSNFAGSSSCPGYAIGVSASAQIKSFTTKVSLQNSTFGSMSDMKINLCDAVNASIGDVSITDSGSLNPSGDGTPGTIWSAGATVVGTTCSDMPACCSKYCMGTSSDVAKLTVMTSYSGTDSVTLEIANTADPSQAYQAFGSDSGSTDPVVNSLNTQRRFFFASVPPGMYTARFIDNTKIVVWPAFALAFINGEITSNFTLEKPSTTCATIAPNGGFSAPVDSSGWYHMGGGLTYVTGNPGNALSTIKRVSWSDGLGTFLDSRCMKAGLSYEVSADVKLVLTAGGSATCDPLATSGDTVCPRADVIALTNNRVTYAAWGVAVLGGPIQSGWNSLYGTFTVTPEMEAADSVFFQIERVIPGVEIQIDNVRFTKVNIGCNANMVKNSGVDFGNFALWGVMGKPGLKVVSPGAPDSTGRTTYYALSTVNRTQWHYGPAQELDPSCFKLGEQYVVQMDVMMQDSNGNPAPCNPYQMTTTRPDACPMVFLKTTQGNSTKISTGPVAVTMGPYNETASKWRKIYSVFRATGDVANATALSFFVGAGVLNKNIVIDNVIVRTASVGDFNLTCANLIRNGDLTVGDARFYAIFGDGNLTMAKPGADGTGFALVHRGRSVYWHGPVQQLDTSCWKSGETWSFTVKMRMKNAATGTWTSCDKAAKFGATWCPTPIIYSVNPTGNMNIMQTVTQSSQYNNTAWDANGWNTFTGTFTVTTEMATYPYVWAYIGNEVAGVDLYVDDWAITKSI
mmetsp:Transcript_21119/g.30171  ORF Transcript_21119/g.30171 Transcript_21119/m.30171 type:complete len:1744 (+) Transcript_21119:152-5383(+)